MSATPKSELVLRGCLLLAAAVVLAVAVPSYLAVTKGDAIFRLVKDAKDLKGALETMSTRGKTTTGATVP
jgi:hypothetical protein